MFFTEIFLRKPNINRIIHEWDMCQPSPYQYFGDINYIFDNVLFSPSKDQPYYPNYYSVPKSTLSIPSVLFEEKMVVPQHYEPILLIRNLQVLQQRYWRQIVDKCWEVIISAGTDRNTLVFDPDAKNNTFTKSLINSMKEVQNQDKKGRLTNLYISSKCIDNIASWLIDNWSEWSVSSILALGIKIHQKQELRHKQQYEKFFSKDLAGCYPMCLQRYNKNELAVGLDLQNRGNFLLTTPVDHQPTITTSRQNDGYHMKMTGRHGIAVLDNTKVLLGAI